MHKRKITSLTSILWLALVLSASLYAGEEVIGKFDALKYTNDKDQTIPYWLMKPKGHDKSKKYPLLLTLHGAPSRGTDGRHVNGSVEIYTFALDEFQNKYPCFVLAPQCPKNITWDQVGWGKISPKLPDEIGWPAANVLKIIEKHLKEDKSIDPSRIYVTGGSMGGVGTWCIIMRRPDLFAAAVPIAGLGDTTKADRLINLPIWAFHGSKDGTVPVEGDRAMIRSIKREGGNPKYTEISGCGHAMCAFNKAKDPEMHEWMMSQSKGAVQINYSGAFRHAKLNQTKCALIQNWRALPAASALYNLNGQLISSSFPRKISMHIVLKKSLSR